MPISINSCHFLGNLTDDARTFDFGDKQKTVFRLAVNKGSRTDYVPCAIWNRPTLAPHLTKGVEVYVEASFKTESFKRDGVTVDRSHFLVDQLELGRSPRATTPATDPEATYDDEVGAGDDFDQAPPGDVATDSVQG